MDSRAFAAPEQIERARANAGIKVEGHGIPAIACVVKPGRLEEWAGGKRAQGGRPPVDGFPFALGETAKSPQSLSYIDRNILPFAGGLFAQRSERHTPCGQADAGHRAVAKGTRHDGISPVKTELSSTIVDGHADIGEDLIDRVEQIKVRRCCGMTKTLLKLVREDAEELFCVLHSFPFLSRFKRWPDRSRLVFVICSGVHFLRPSPVRMPSLRCAINRSRRGEGSDDFSR